MKVVVQFQDFSLEEECRLLLQGQAEAGALASFVGVVRSDHQKTNEAYSLELEHYPHMTEKVITEMVELAVQRFDLLDVTVIHRVGCLHAGEQIVLVAVISPHRRAAFNGCEFIMDYLKTQAPFWKKENSNAGAAWVEAKEADDQALKRWGIHSNNTH